MKTFNCVLTLTASIACVFCHFDNSDDSGPQLVSRIDDLHFDDDPHYEDRSNGWQDTFASPVGPENEQRREFWMNQGQNILLKKISKRQNLNKAKNVVIFIGDGMGLSTQMATRVFIGDEKTELSFEKFPYSGLSKTYCINYQVPDSACTATAIFAGIKNNYNVISLTGDVNLSNCTAQQDTKTHIDNIFKYAQDAGKSTGFVTTTRITHATLAAAYAKAASRHWESNQNTPAECEDIAHQLIHGEIGSRLDVAMGGGMRHFLPNTMIGESGFRGWRTDNRNLVNEFIAKYQGRQRVKVVQNRDQLLSVDAASTDKILGIFTHSHLEYKMLADAQQQPTLLELTSKALEVLGKNENGFVLLVEGGRIDHAHHGTMSQLALSETVEFHKTVEYAKSVTNEQDTLLLATADHSHVFTVGGYPPRQTNILSVGDVSRTDQMGFFTLNYANGPGHEDHFLPTGGRRNPQFMNYMDQHFRYPATVPKQSETHAGEDVGVYASGPYAHLFSGVYEQSYIGHALMYATCLGPDDFKKNPQCTDGASVKIASLWMFVTAVIISIMNY